MEIIKLEYLLIDNNQIKEIPDWINTFKRLKSISISNNILSKISSNIGDLVEKLTYINFGNNRIE